MKPTPIATPVKAFEAIALLVKHKKHDKDERYYNSKASKCK